MSRLQYIPRCDAYRFTRNGQPDWSASLITDGYGRDWYFSYSTLVAFKSNLDIGTVINRDMASSRSTSNHIGAIIEPGTPGDRIKHVSVNDKDFTELMRLPRTPPVDPPSDSPEDTLHATAWLIAADYLEEHGDPTGAKLLRDAIKPTT